MSANLENSAVATGLEKVSFHSNPKERQCQRMFKPPHYLFHTLLISHTSKVMLKILQVKLQQYMYWELPEVQPGLRKCRGTRDQISNIHSIIERQENYRKTSSTSAPPMTLKPLTVWITRNCGKFLKRWEYQTTYLPPQNLDASQEATYNRTWNNGLVPNWERSISRLYIVTLLI